MTVRFFVNVGFTINHIFDKLGNPMRFADIQAIMSEGHVLSGSSFPDIAVIDPEADLVLKGVGELKCSWSTNIIDNDICRQEQTLLVPICRWFQIDSLLKAHTNHSLRPQLAHYVRIH